MRRRFAQIVIFATAFLLSGMPCANAQSKDSNASCADSVAPDDKKPSGSDISVAEVTFSGSLQMPVSDQQEMAAGVMQKTRGTSLEDVTDEGLERVRAEWQDRGYFKVQVNGETKTLTSSPISERIAINVQVEEGARYNVKGIRFRNNKVISDVELLRGLFPIAAGQFFSRGKVGAGLENLRKAYGELGYINFTAVPETIFDDANSLISLVIDFDEGKQFRVGKVNVLGLDESARQQMLNSFPIKSGQIYSSSIWEESLLKYVSMVPECDCSNHEQVREDTNSGVVTLTLDFRSCSTK